MKAEDIKEAFEIADNVIQQLYDHAQNIIAGSDEIIERDQEIADSCARYLQLRRNN